MLPPVVSSGLTTFERDRVLALGITTIVFGSTLPSGPALTAVTFTRRGLGEDGEPDEVGPGHRDRAVGPEPDAVLAC